MWRTCDYQTSARPVRLNGWVNSYRNLGGLLFLDLRDRYGITQVMIDPNSFDPAQLTAAQHARAEFVVAVVGTSAGAAGGDRQRQDADRGDRSGRERVLYAGGIKDAAV